MILGLFKVAAAQLDERKEPKAYELELLAEVVPNRPCDHLSADSSMAIATEDRG